MYVLRKAIDLIAALGGAFIEDYRTYLERRIVPEAIRYALYENALIWEKSDEKALEFIKDRKISELSPRSIQCLMRRFGVGTKKDHQQLLKDIVKSTAEFINTKECAHPEYYLILEAQLCGSEVNHRAFEQQKADEISTRID